MAAAASSAEATLPAIKADGLTPLFDNTAAAGKNIDVVFVHGLNGHPKGTWTHANGFFWPWELRDRLQKARVMTFGYNAGVGSDLAKNLIRIRGIASALNDALANKRITKEELGRPVVFVGHSLGGLVAKAATVLASDGQVAGANDIDKLYASLRGYMFFGTPHGGSAMLGKTRVKVLEKMAKVAFAEIPPKLEEALQQGSDELLDLADNFRKTSHYVHAEYIIASYYETNTTAVLGGRVVDEFSATVLGYHKANDPVPISATHTEMVKFAGHDDGKLDDIEQLLKRWVVRLTEGQQS